MPLINDPDNLSQGASTAVSDATWGTPTGNQVTITSAAWIPLYVAPSVSEPVPVPSPRRGGGGGGVMSTPRLVPEPEELVVELEDRVLSAAYGTILADGDGAVALAALFALILEGDED